MNYIVIKIIMYSCILKVNLPALRIKSLIVVPWLATR